MGIYTGTIIDIYIIYIQKAKKRVLIILIITLVQSMFLGVRNNFNMNTYQFADTDVLLQQPVSVLLSLLGQRA